MISVMVRSEISLIRFRWKIPSWMTIENINAIWFYSEKGIPSFEYELNEKVSPPKELQDHARNSRFAHLPHFIRITDPRIIAEIGQILPKCDVCGALGRGIIIGQIDLKLDKNGQGKKVFLMTTLSDWRDWLESTQQKIIKREFT